MSGDFAMQRELGLAGEKMVAGFLQSRGAGVVASYDFSGSDGDKAPRMMFQAYGRIIPDLDVSRGGERFWVEVKTYWHAPPNRRIGFPVHGIRRRHRENYLDVQKQSGTTVLLAILEVQSGQLLVRRLDALRIYDCQCRTCVRGTVPNHNVYFGRHDFSLWHQFSVVEMAGLRALFGRQRAA